MLSSEEYDKVARSDCFVCRIIEGNPLIPYPQIIFEDDKVIAFLSQRPTQEGYTIVSPKKHLERFEDMNQEDWLYLQQIVQKLAKAVSSSTNAARMYLASWGSPERNPHIHIHICPCPQNTPFEKQQLKAMDPEEGKVLDISNSRMKEIATDIKNYLE